MLHLGLTRVQSCWPKPTSRTLTSLHREGGNQLSSACRVFSGVLVAWPVHPKRLAILWTCVSTPRMKIRQWLDQSTKFFSIPSKFKQIKCTNYLSRLCSSMRCLRWGRPFFLRHQAAGTALWRFRGRHPRTSPSRWWPFVWCNLLFSVWIKVMILN